MNGFAKLSFSALVVAVALSVAPSDAEAAAGLSSSAANDAEVLLCPAPPAEIVPGLRLAQASGKHSQGADMRDPGYNSQYIFGMTKGIAESTLNPGLKPLLFLFTIPLDIVTLPFSAIAGFF